MATAAMFASHLTGGSITGGRYRNKSANFLERKAEISQLENRLKDMNKVNFSTEKTKVVLSGQGISLYRSLYEIASDISIVDFKDYKSKFNNLDNYFTFRSQSKAGR